MLRNTRPIRLLIRLLVVGHRITITMKLLMVVYGFFGKSIMWMCKSYVNMLNLYTAKSVIETLNSVL